MKAVSTLRPARPVQLAHPMHPVQTQRASGAALRAGRHRRGFTLIDLLVVITLTGTIAGTMTTVFSRLAAQSAQALRSREVHTLARSLLTEVQSMPFGPCDADDARFRSASRAVVGPAPGCATRVDGAGPEPGETRYGATPATPFDGVSDYHGFTMPGPGCATFCARNGVPLGLAGRLAGCSAGVAVTPVALPGLSALDADGQAQALRIVVSVRCPGEPEVVAEGVRVRRVLAADL